jgi:Ser/Thr protein kinase RdoA (MazF antagonist)
VSTSSSNANPKIKPFREISRRGRLFRLRKLAITALGRYGMDDASLQFIQYGENAIYRVDSSGVSERDNPVYLPNRYALRIHAMSDIDAVESELIWLEALNREAGLPVPAPVCTKEGRLLTTVTMPGIPHGRVVSLLRWMEGQKIQKGLRPDHLFALGRVVAQMHTFSAGWQPPANFTRPTWDWDAQLGGSLFEYSREELVASMPVHFQGAFEAVSLQARQAMERLGKGLDAFGLIHADLYPENVLFKAGRAYPIDFEDCGYGYWMWDIAVALCTWAWDNNWDRMRDAFQKGYTQYRTLPAEQWALLDLFVATQFATMVLWASAFLKHDPMRTAEYIPWRDRNGRKLVTYFDRLSD